MCASFFLGETSIALDALFLFEHAAADDAKGEAEDRHGDRCWWIVVFDGSSTICAIVPGQIGVLLRVLVPALGTPAIHNAWWVCGLQLCGALTLGRDLRAVEALVAALSNTFYRLWGRFTHFAASSALL